MTFVANGTRLYISTRNVSDGGLSVVWHNPDATSKRVTRVSLGAEDVLPWTYHASSLEAVRKLQTEGFTPIALELPRCSTHHSIAIPENARLLSATKYQEYPKRC